MREKGDEIREDKSGHLTRVNIYVVGKYVVHT
jgi:hypothetical protein